MQITGCDARRADGSRQRVGSTATAACLQQCFRLISRSSHWMGGLGNSTSKDSIVASAAASASTAVQATPLAGPASCSAIVYSMCVYCCCQSVLMQKRSSCVVATESLLGGGSRPESLPIRRCCSAGGKLYSWQNSQKLTPLDGSTKDSASQLPLMTGSSH